MIAMRPALFRKNSINKHLSRLYLRIRKTPIGRMIGSPLMANTIASVIHNRWRKGWHWDEPGAVILVYHDINPLIFDKHIEFISKYWEILSLDNLCERIKTNQNNGNSVVITFDDGYASNYKLLPVIVKHNIPATIYLVSDVIGTNREFWWVTIDNLRALLKRHKGDEVVLHDHEYYCGLPETEREAEISRAISQLKYKPRHRCALSIQEIQAFLRTGLITFGSHSRNHPTLNMASKNVAKEEILGSKKLLEAKIGVDINHFAYPHGNFNEKHIKVVTKAGYKSAVTLIPQLNTSSTNIYKLRRIYIEEQFNTSVLAVKISGLWDKLGFNGPNIQFLSDRGIPLQ